MKKRGIYTGKQRDTSWAIYLKHFAVFAVLGGGGLSYWDLQN